MDWFDRVQHDNLEALAEVNSWMASRLRELDGLYLFGTIGMEAALLRDGTVRVWSADSWFHSEEYTERAATPEEHIAAIVFGSENWPELRELLPLRPATARTCSVCAGVARAKQGLICPNCQGLGWVNAPAI